MKKELLTTLNNAARATTDDYGHALETIARSFGYIIAALLFAGQLTREYARKFETWADQWQGNPFDEPQLQLAAINPARVIDPEPTIESEISELLEPLGSKRNKKRRARGFA